MIARVAASLVVAVVWSPALAQESRNCRHPPFTFCDGCDVPVTVTVKPGAFCAFNYQATGGVRSQKVIARPRQGIYGSANATKGGLQVNKDARGEDSFEVEIAYERLGRPTATRIKARVIIEN